MVETRIVKPIALETRQEVDSWIFKDESIDVLTDPIRKVPSSRIMKNHPSDLITGDLNEGTVTRKRFVNHVKYVCFVCLCELKNMKEALLDEFRIKARYEELQQFSQNNVWNLVPRQENTNVIGTKWIFKINLMSLVTLLKIRLGWSPKVAHKLRVLILMRLLLLLLG